MYCRKCGSELREKINFCTKCGMKTKEEPDQVKVTKSKKASINIQLSHKILFRIMCILLIITILLALYFIGLSAYNKYRDMKTEISEDKKRIESLESSVRWKEQDLSTYKKKADFLDRCIVVAGANTKIYHKYGCSLLDTSYGYYAFNSESAKYQGYKPCKTCIR